MFSTISNMLPNLSLQDKDSPTGNTTNPFDKIMAVKRRFEGARTSHTVEVEEEEPVQEERREERKEKKKQKPLNETFVVVRPPPSVSNHPLNLQLQLIPPTIPITTTHMPRSASTSTTASTSSAGGERGYAAAGGVPNVPPVSAGLQSKKEAQRQQTTDTQDDDLLNRRVNRSDLSLFYSSMASSASVTSFSTVASTTTTSGTRRIIPLYNLSAHNVLQNTVQDAGTDATVSRFRKRGIDIVGLGILEPVEVHGIVPVGTVASYPSGPQPCDPEGVSDAGHGSNLGHGGVSESDHSPPSQSGHLKDSSGGYLKDRPSQISLHNQPSQSNIRGRISPSPPSQLREVTLPDETPKGSSGKGFFGKLFKKKEPGTPTTPTSPAFLSPSITPRGSSNIARGITPVNRTAMLTPQPTARPTNVHSARPTSVYSVVPPSPATASPSTPTATSYLQPPVLGTQSTLRAEVYPPTGRPTAYVWVIREWTKGGGMFSVIVGTGGVDMVHIGVEVRFEWVRGKKKREKGEYGPPAGRPVSVVSLGEDNLPLPEGASFRSVSPDMRSRRGSETRPRTRSSASPTKPRVQPSSSDDGDESDPEDSETPWSCTLRVLPVDSTTSEPLKLRLAHLVPAPHHPKVIGQFKMPFPLPDVHIQNLELIPRSVNDPFGMEREAGMVMSAEEIKDVVCTTALWLMVREGFGDA
ncbi:unnamed protein product [Rhizoctonia solani]|uniref:Uncharacterized protein n=1 Tax=Rhizoctonia solani TaxID=456999 RepID=A0A8H3D5H6_9AGAM|nr:unnamed protein product [Rhizoctonia solani]